MDIRAAVASRTDEPGWAKFCMEHLVVEDGTTLSCCFGKLVEISFQDKTHHFKRLHDKTGIPYQNMAFFDNEHWNIKQVSKLGVKCFYTPDGMNQQHWLDTKKFFGINN
jgi:magnesium-dependent phosphatase 1